MDKSFYYKKVLEARDKGLKEVVDELHYHIISLVP
jgi:hypothetical protein